MVNKKTWAPPPRPARGSNYTVEVDGYTKIPGETIPRRNAACKDGLKLQPEPGVDTLYAILKRSAEKYGNARAVGSRPVIDTHEEVKKIKKVVDGKETETEKKWTFLELGEYKYQTFIEFERTALQVGSGLRKLGLEKGDKVELFASTSQYWLATAHGASSQSMPIVTAYDTLGEEGLQHSLKQTGAKAIYLDPSLLTKVIKPLQVATEVKVVIYNGDLDVKEADIEKLKAAHQHLQVLSFKELITLGAKDQVAPVPPTPEDLCCIMYTSGSMGPPKGVLLKHKNVVASVAGVDVVVGAYIGPGDGLLTYLPLAHILEFVFENACLYWGGTMGYGNPRTLSDTSVRNCKGDIREFKPTILVGVPAVWESVKKGIQAKVAAGGPVVSRMFWGAMHAKSTLMNYGIPGSGVLDSVVFNKIKDATGGRLRVIMSGGSPVAKDTLRFLSLAICPMIGGYGLTETGAMGAVCDPGSWTDDAVGEVTGCIEVKLVDAADLGYKTDGKVPQGEVWIRGGSVATGYLDLEQETKESFTDDGWFKTGDIGEFDSRGFLKIIDRKKNLVKTLNGEYIALEKLESIYRSAALVANICVYAAQDKNKPVAIIVPAEPALKKLAEQNGISDTTFESLVANKKVNGLVLQELHKAGRAGGLAGIELVDGVVLADEEWTPQNGFTTSAQKLSRKAILTRYKKDVDEAYRASA